jgi:hypothetical protein
MVIVTAVFITCLITANIIAVKVISLGFFILPAAAFVFPVSYIFGDVLTEVYGYRTARRVIYYHQRDSGRRRRHTRPSWATRRSCWGPPSAATWWVSLPTRSYCPG